VVIILLYPLFLICEFFLSVLGFRSQGFTSSGLFALVSFQIGSYSPPLLLCWVRVHCSIFKGSHSVSNVLYLNSSPPQLSFIPLPGFQEQFQQAFFCICMYTCVYITCTVFSLLHLSLPSSFWQNLFLPPVLRFCRNKNRKVKKRNMTSLLV
jgi:hypothetical protein